MSAAADEGRAAGGRRWPWIVLLVVAVALTMGLLWFAGRDVFRFAAVGLAGIGYAASGLGWANGYREIALVKRRPVMVRRGKPGEQVWGGERAVRDVRVALLLLVSLLVSTYVVLVPDPVASPTARTVLVVAAVVTLICSTHGIGRCFGRCAVVLESVKLAKDDGPRLARPTGGV
jgi:hypothetical protein